MLFHCLGVWVAAFKSWFSSIFSLFYTWWKVRWKHQILWSIQNGLAKSWFHFYVTRDAILSFFVKNRCLGEFQMKSDVYKFENFQNCSKWIFGMDLGFFSLEWKIYHFWKTFDHLKWVQWRLRRHLASKSFLKLKVSWAEICQSQIGECQEIYVLILPLRMWCFDFNKLLLQNNNNCEDIHHFAIHT